MNQRSVITLACIAAVVAVLGIRRGCTEAGPSVDERAAPEAVALPAILDFGRGTCIPCRQMMPVLEQARATYAGVVDVRYLDLSEPQNAARARDLGVKLIPTQVFVSADGTEVHRHEGFLPLDAIERKLAELGWTPAR